MFIILLTDEPLPYTQIFSFSFSYQLSSAPLSLLKRCILSMMLPPPYFMVRISFPTELLFCKLAKKLLPLCGVWQTLNGTYSEFLLTMMLFLLLCHRGHIYLCLNSRAVSRVSNLRRNFRGFLTSSLIHSGILWGQQCLSKFASCYTSHSDKG